MSIGAALRNLLVKDFDPATAELYGVCVAAARQPVFYAQAGVPDTVDGRFDLLLLHVLLVILRLKDSAAKQNLFDCMFRDMERSLREMGVGDMSIGKKMKPMLAGFYGRAEAYDKALSATDDAPLIAALSRNLFGRVAEPAEHAGAVAHYIRRAVTHLQNLSDAELANGKLSFPTIPQE